MSHVWHGQGRIQYDHKLSPVPFTHIAQVIENLMAILHILHYPDPRLRIKAMPVHKVDDEIRQLLDDMLETMK
jgi:hypothetical protein